MKFYFLRNGYSVFSSNSELTVACGELAQNKENGDFDVYQKIGTVTTKEVAGVPLPFYVGQKVKTRDGRHGRIICVDAKDKEYPVFALFEDMDLIRAQTKTYTPGGLFLVNDTSGSDLIPSSSQCFEADFTPETSNG